MLIIQVALPLYIFKTFSYSLASNTRAKVGCRVYVSFRRQELIGIIVSIFPKKNMPVLSNIKEVTEIIDIDCIIPENIWTCLLWASKYYSYPLGYLIFRILPFLLRNRQTITSSSLHFWTITTKGLKINPAVLMIPPRQKEALATLREEPIYFGKKYGRLRINSTTLRALATKKLAQLVVLSGETYSDIFNNYNYNIIKNTKKPIDSFESQAMHIIEKLNTFSVWVLEGVKRKRNAFYITIIWQILLQGKQVLFIAPKAGDLLEIEEDLKRFFNVPVMILHAGISKKKYLSIWNKAKQGIVAILIATGHALFTPFKRLGIIIFEEEDDHSYNIGNDYLSRVHDLAIYLAKCTSIPIILGSSTPKSETLYNVHKNKYSLISLFKKNSYNYKHLSQEIIDLKRRNTWLGFSNVSIECMKEEIEKRNDVIILLTYDKYVDPILLCDNCGKIPNCLSCNKNFIFLPKKKKLYCYTCDQFTHFPLRCDFCKCSFFLRIEGRKGIQIKTMLETLFPKILVIYHHKKKHDKAVKKNHRVISESFNDSKISIFSKYIGRQHNITKKTTLIILPDIDDTLLTSDFRSTEYLAQIYTKILEYSYMGQAVKILLHTYYPENPIFYTLTKGYRNFMKVLLLERQAMRLPPWTNQVLIYNRGYKPYDIKYNLTKLRNILYSSP